VTYCAFWRPQPLPPSFPASASGRRLFELPWYANNPEIPGFSLHETGTCRMGNDPKHFVTNRFGQTHDVPNLYVCDATVFLNCTDKTTTISILTFSLRTSEYLVENFRGGEHKAA
jgi:choline dehydrogenase-like flavoprotein